MAAAPLYCVCRQPYDVSRFMIECDICKDWFHGSCVQVEEHHAVDIDVYHCPNCDVIHGPSLMKKRNNWHRHDYTEPDDGTKPVQAGTSVFVKELRARTFPSSADDILVRMQGSQVTQKYLEKQGFQYPIAVAKLDGLGLQLPPPSFSVKDVEQYVGSDKIIDVIDVARQADSKMKLGEFVKYFYSPSRPKVLNVISLEFSDTKMAELVVVPDIAQKMSWVENYWPDDSFFPKPFVQKYCLMGVKDSYTDFHIDFGGTSVWYHVLWGEKIFYLIKPTPANLALYEAWSSSPNQSEVFFGEKVDKCYKCVVRQGTTLLIPTGWIHAVLTSQDCMAFGGNFLHNLNIAMQLRCYEMERRLKTPDLFKFPYFEAICWYVAKNLLETLKELREDNCQPPAYLVEGVKALTTALRNWLKREVTEPASEVPDHIRPNHLIKELTKEIRYQEEEQGGAGGSKPMKSQGSGMCPVTRSTLERGTQARRTARRLRDHHAAKTPSNLDILELHTREVLRRLEVAPFEEDTAFSSRVNGKFNKVSTASAAAVERSLDNDLRLVLCNGRIIRDQRQRATEKSMGTAGSDGPVGPQKDTGRMKVERDESGQGQRSTKERDEKPRRIKMFLESVKSELRNGGSSGHSEESDSGSEDSCTTQQKDSSEDDSGSSEEEEEEKEAVSSRREAGRGSGRVMDLYPANQRHRHRSKPLKRERPTSPSTEEAIQGMLSMAGLLCPQQPDEGATSQEPWWSSPAHPSPNCGGGEESQGDSDSNSALSHQGALRPQSDLRTECRPGLHQRIQESKKFMDSQSSGSSSSSSEAWANHRLSPDPPSPLRRDASPGMEYQYSETSLSPPLHPSKRLASNPPPISNQATKGKRPKKGMATAKQRLGKILKLNRHSRFFV
ncbi:lysine-specific demethylase 7B isoform X1 [Megalops cyprinoides]|uniref:lysine-specific demethylase 7B isoform X1 n=1 Tax=Megalops cyprinoides TaxID=118141 RepID=UPI00186415D9|nr:lysine-specific demethylase 7B isoform X1 [Megalops cyprinoides]